MFTALTGAWQVLHLWLTVDQVDRHAVLLRVAATPQRMDVLLVVDGDAAAASSDAARLAGTARRRASRKRVLSDGLAHRRRDRTQRIDRGVVAGVDGQ